MSDGASPLVSVGIPTYNRLPYLREAIASVREQTHPSWELFVVDDGSEDGTAEFVLGIRDDRVHLVRLLHSGNIARLRNRGVQEARGEYVAFLDSDDLWEPRKLEAQLAALRATPECRWSYTKMVRMDASGTELNDPGVREFVPYSGSIVKELLRFDTPVDAVTLLAERSLLEELGGFDESVSPYCSDYELIFRLGIAARAVAVPGGLVRVRVHPDAHSSDREAAHRCFVGVYGGLAETLTDPELRRICRIEQRRHRLSQASRLAEAGHTGAATREVAAVLLRSPWVVRAWLVFLVQILLNGLLRRGRRGRSEPPLHRRSAQ